MAGLLSGKTAIITGAGRGVGQATARAFVAEGASVLIADIDAARLDLVAEELGSSAISEKCDVSSELDWDRVVKRAMVNWGQIDVLANIAGTIFTGLIIDTPAEEYERVNRINGLGTFLGIRSVARPMMAAKSGSIINYASTAVFYAAPGIGAYLASKHAIRGLTKAAAMELAPHGIRVNCVCGPGGNPNFVTDAPKSAPMANTFAGGDPMVHVHDGQGGRYAELADKLMAISRVTEHGADWGDRSVPTMVFLASALGAGYNGSDFVLDEGVSVGVEANRG